ncbi:MAG: hypothetical protein WC459_03015 [Patescibacteria group bacterium]
MEKFDILKAIEGEAAQELEGQKPLDPGVFKPAKKEITVKIKAIHAPAEGSLNKMRKRL